MTDPGIIEWLLEGDISIQYQVYRDLLKTERPDLKKRIAYEGWGAKFLSFRNKNGHWGDSFYQPKWISSHYTLLDLKNLCISNDQQEIKKTINSITRLNKAPDGGVSPVKSLAKSDVCVCGMFLNYASYFGTDEKDIRSVVDFIISQEMEDGGFNCYSNWKKPSHSSLHTTLSVIEGIEEYKMQGYKYRLAELKKAEKRSREFLLEHKLFQSHRTGETIDKKMLMLSYPSRWRYDILRSLDYFRSAGCKYDPRMSPAINILLKKRHPDMKWVLQAKHTGLVHFEMEKTGKASRWNTLRALRVLNHFEF